MDNFGTSYNGTMYDARIYSYAFNQTDVSNLNDQLFAS